MARTPSDATRFTATGPYASAGSSFTSNASTSSGTRISFDSPIPENETPQQKIARLRAAAATSKRVQETQYDQVVRVGRKWADRAHRFTALSLIGLTVLSAMVGGAGVIDMLMHNRRKRNEWLAEQQANTKRDLKEAFAARARGEATDDQMLLINRERAAAEAAELRRNKPGVFKRAKNWLLGGASPDQPKGGSPDFGAADAPAVFHAMKMQLQDEGPHTEILATSGQRDKVVAERLRPRGGLLDQEAQRAADAASTVTRNWISWLSGSR